MDHYTCNILANDNCQASVQIIKCIFESLVSSRSIGKQRLASIKSHLFNFVIFFYIHARSPKRVRLEAIWNSICFLNEPWSTGRDS